MCFLLLAAESFLATHTLGTSGFVFGAFGPTELRILLAVGALVASIGPSSRPSASDRFCSGISVASAALPA